MGTVLRIHAPVSISVSGADLYTDCGLLTGSCLWLHVCDECGRYYDAVKGSPAKCVVYRILSGTQLF